MGQFRRNLGPIEAKRGYCNQGGCLDLFRMDTGNSSGWKWVAGPIQGKYREGASVDRSWNKSRGDTGTS